MALRSGYKGFKKLLPGLKIIRPGTLGIDNTELSKTFFPRSEQAVLSAKNWFNIDAPNTVYNATLTKTDTSLRVQGSSQTYSNVNYVFRHLLSNTAYTLQANIDYTSGLGKVSVEGSTEGSSYTTIASNANIKSDQDVSISFNTGNYTYIRVIFFCSDSVAIDGDITYSHIMIKLATDTDDTYAPYAMTNKELTDKMSLKESACTNPAGTESVNKLYKQGNVVYCVLSLTGVTEEAYGVLGNLPTGYRIPTNTTLKLMGSDGKEYVVYQDGNIVCTSALTNVNVHFNASWITL